MKPCFAIGYSSHTLPYEAGKLAAQQALKAVPNPSLAICIASIHLDLQAVLQGVLELIPAKILCGGSSYAEISQAGVTKNSVVILLIGEPILCGLTHASLDHGVEKAGFSLGSSLKPLARDLKQFWPVGLLITSIGRDGYSDPSEAVYNGFGNLALFGGLTCGNYDLGMSHPDFWTNYQFIENTVQTFYSSMALLNIPKDQFIPAFAFTHGWQKIGPVQTITKASRSLVYEIDNIPIIDYYKQFLGENPGPEFFESMIQRYSLSLELGENETSKSLIKLPVACNFEEGWIHYLPSDNLQGKKVRLMQANRMGVIRGARQAALQCKEALNGEEPELLFIISCCSRSGILHSRPQAEIDAIRDVFGYHVPCFGYYSGGELVPYASRIEEVLDSESPLCGSAYHGSTVCIMALARKNQPRAINTLSRFTTSECVNQSRSVEELELLLKKSENILDDTEQFLTHLSLRGIEREESLKRLQSIINTYTAREVIEQASLSAHAGANELTEESVELVYLFLDIKGFTAFSENHSPHEVIRTINQIFDPVTNILMEHGADVDKFIGDCIFAVLKEPAQAMSAAQKILGLHKELEKQGLPFALRIGMNWGRSVRGSVGSKVRRDYTYIGDAVNLAQRLESACTPNHVLISENLASMVDFKGFIAVPKELKLKGKQVAVRAFECSLA
ncbi:MAG: FIST C-terminal domain-containing protein [Candidatus Cloacimonetes bacterium]|nr:FIST C-terminal domain-containing protein [Candidatus Cloacimonadota bacterium]